MTYEEAIQLSHRLRLAQISHTVDYGYHEKLAPPDHVRVSIVLPIGGLRSESFWRIEQVVAPLAVVIRHGFSGGVVLDVEAS